MGYDVGTSDDIADRDTYWASKPTDEIGDEILKKVENYQDYLDSSGRLSIMQASYVQYYKAIGTYADIQRAGPSGQFSLISINEYRNIILHIISLTASERIAFDPVAINTDSESIAQCTLAQGLLEYYMREKRLEAKVKKALETAMWAGEAFCALSWDIGAGDAYGIDPETGRPTKAGDVTLRVYNPGSCIRDYNLNDPAEERWRILVNLESRYELMAKYPQLADRIKQVSADKRLWQYFFNMDGTFTSSDELIPVFEFRHDKTDAIPNGRIVKVLSSDVILVDSPLPYKSSHIYRITPNDQDNTIFGYTVGYDMLPIQSALDSMYSIALTNLSTFGVQCIAVPQGSEITQDDVTGGMKILYYNSQLGVPSPLQLTATAPETYNFMGQLSAAMEKMAAINPITRGDPGALPQVKSGAAMALIQSMAIQFNSALQQSFVNLAEDIGTGIIEILQTFASQPRVAQIAGKSKRTLIKYWTSDDLSSIRRVTVNIGNPMMRTVAGRENLGEQLLSNGLIKNADQLLQVYNTGKLDPLTQYPLAELQLINDENESFMNGVYSPPIITDNHDEHIREHGVVLASVEARKNPSILNVTLDHIMEHLRLKSEQPPTLAQLYGQIPVVPMAPMGAPPEMPQNGPIEPTIQNAPNKPSPGTKMPTNPLTGEKFDLATGGGVVGL